MDEKQNPVKKSTVPEEYMGILIGERELIEKYGETVPEVAVYGGIEPSPNVIKFLQLPARMRIHSQLDKVNASK